MVLVFCVLKYLILVNPGLVPSSLVLPSSAPEDNEDVAEIMNALDDVVIQEAGSSLEELQRNNGNRNTTFLHIYF